MSIRPAAEADCRSDAHRAGTPIYIPDSILLDPPDTFAQTTCDVIAVFFATIIVCATAASVGVAAFLVFFVRW